MTSTWTWMRSSPTSAAASESTWAGWTWTPRLGDVQTEGARGVLEAAIASVPGGKPTIGDLARYRAKAQQIVGTPEQIVDEIERWQDAGMDGLNIMNQILPGSYTDFIDGILPELRARGLAQTEYAPGTLREKVFGRGARLEATHPAAQFRGAFSEYSAANTEETLAQAL